MQSSSQGFQVQFTVTIPAIEPQALKFDSDVESGADRMELGRGGFGIVYAGRYQGQPVAIKTLHVTTASIVEALHKEAAVMFRTASPYTVKLQGICSTPKVTSLVMERMSGGSLFHLLQDKSQELPWVLRYRLAYEIAEGLWALHSQEIIHRDLKSLNVLLDGEQHAKITDFGFSRLRGQITSVAASSKHSLGTPAYKSPELVEQDLADSESDSDSDEEKVTKVKGAKKPSPYSPYSDVYAYGVILWEIATRKIPFDGVSQRRIEKKIQGGKHEKIPADCPPEFAALIKSCWAMKAGQRPRTDKLVVQMKALYETAEAERVAALAAVQDKENEEKIADYIPAPWHIDKTIFQTLGRVENYARVPAGAMDFAKVKTAYERAPVAGKNLARVEIVYSYDLDVAFAATVRRLERRHNNPAFLPHWQQAGEEETNREKNNKMGMWQGGEYKAWRQKMADVLTQMAAPTTDPKNPHVTLLPMWHATAAEVLPSLFSAGFANLATVDPGFFGKGIYSAGEACYSHDVYGKIQADNGYTPVLLMNWVVCYSPYPVIEGDKQFLEGGSNYANHDAHFIPVRPMTPNPNESVFYPCAFNQPYTYTELVVFDPSQCLARYVVELQSDLLKTPQEIIDAKLKSTAEQAQKAKAKQQAEAEEKALLAQQAAEQAQKQSESLEKEKERERIKAEQIEAEKAAAVKQAVEAAKKEAHREKQEAEQKAADLVVKAQQEQQKQKAQAAQQAKELQALKEKLAQAEAEKAEAKVAAEKQKAAQEQTEKEAVKQSQIAAALQKAQAAQAQQALQAEKAQKEAAREAQAEADLKQAQKKLQAEEAAKNQAKLKAKAEQAEKTKAEEAEKRRAAEEVKDDEDKTEGRIKAYSPLKMYSPLGRLAFWKQAHVTPPKLAQFLRLVAEGEQDKAEAMLKANPNLILQSGTVTDLSKRTFEHITAFQYAIWARDWHMWTMLLKYLPEEEAALQLHSLETNGTEHGKQFDFGTLLGAYQTLEQNWGQWKGNQRDTHWVKQVGGAQLLVPAHVANEYSRPDRPFYPLPDFTQGGLPRERGSSGGQEWYARGALGERWSWVRGIGRVWMLSIVPTSYRYIILGQTPWEVAKCPSLITPEYRKEIIRDAGAVQQLVTTREQQLQLLKTALYRNRQGLVAKAS